jgi:hypothetical protein
MHILFLTDNFPPEVNAPAGRTFEHCREWVRAGHTVTVVTCAPNFPKGRVYPGYRNRPFARETMGGIQVVRVWTYVSPNEGVVRRTLDYASFMASAMPACLWIGRPDLVIATSPQIFTACAGYLTSRMLGVPFVFELRDLWPASIQAVGAIRQTFLLDALQTLELFLYRKAAAVIAATAAFKENLVSRGIDASKIHVVTNGVDLARFKPGLRDESLARERGLEGKFVAGYIGTHGMAHALETLLDAASRLQRDGNDDIHLLFLGDGARKAALQQRARELRLRNVTFVDSVPRDHVASYWSLLDACVIHLKNDDLFSTVIPSKLFEAMAMGIPIVHGVPGQSAAIVEAEGAGLTFEPENATELCERLLRLSRDQNLAQRLGANGIEAAKKYDRRVLAAQLLDILLDQFPLANAADREGHIAPAQRPGNIVSSG